ncbi:MAG: hypothetical protein AAB883_02750 [Patescibacteria group bacterium]
MPDRTISILSYTACGLVLAYMVLMVSTVSLAAYRTDLASNVRDAESAISDLERSYYVAIDQVTETNPAVLGLVKPHTVTYATQAPTNALTRR